MQTLTLFFYILPSLWHKYSVIVHFCVWVYLGTGTDVLHIYIFTTFTDRKVNCCGCSTLNTMGKIHHLPSVYSRTLPGVTNLSRDPIHSFNYDGILIISEKYAQHVLRNVQTVLKKNTNGINRTQAFVQYQFSWGKWMAYLHCTMT